MSQVLFGFFELADSKKRRECSELLKKKASKTHITFYEGTECHIEPPISPYIYQENKFIFSFSDALKYDTCNNLIMPDLCRDASDVPLKMDIANIAELIYIMLYYTREVNLYLGVWGCQELEYHIQNVVIAHLSELLISYINSEVLFPKEKFLISASN